MSNLVDRLRDGPQLGYDASDYMVVYRIEEVDQLLEEAANRIEQLENAMKEIQNTLYGAAR